MPCKGTPTSQCRAPHCVRVRQTSKRKGHCRSRPKRKTSSSPKKTAKTPVKKFKVVKSGKSSPKKKTTKTPVKKYKVVKSGTSSKNKPAPKKSHTTSPKKKAKKSGPKQKKSAKIPKGEPCSLYELANKHGMGGFYDTMIRKGNTPAQYRKAYLNLSRFVHPDKLTNSICHGNHLAFKQLSELQVKRMSE